MKAKIMGRTIEIPDERVRGGHGMPTKKSDGSNPSPSPTSIILSQNERSAFRSKLEENYARYLHGLLLAGDIRQYRYEPMRFNLAPLTTITPDFQVVTKEGQMEYHEVKGFAREDAMAKLKICARLYPEWKFWLVKRKRGVWELKELPV